jgi:hypothetical protein
VSFVQAAPYFPRHIPLQGDARPPQREYFKSVRVTLRSLKEVTSMIKWNPRFARLLLVIGTLGSLLVASGAGTRWAVNG